jgi:hypothetical protein
MSQTRKKLLKTLANALAWILGSPARAELADKYTVLQRFQKPVAMSLITTSKRGKAMTRELIKQNLLRLDDSWRHVQLTWLGHLFLRLAT